jgi:shikimate dehydrogenase
MSTHPDIAALQACIDNVMEVAAIGDRRLAGVVGGAPSRYSKSPALWNAAFHLLRLQAVYVPFDVRSSRLGDLMAALRSSERMLGVNVTVPHKLTVMECLDNLDPPAARIHAVNTIVREPDGRLVGYNTDGAGFVESLLKPQPGRAEPFIEALNGFDVLLLGAGGSARAVAFYVAQLLTNGELLICNRTLAHAAALAHEIRVSGGRARAVPEHDLPQSAVKVGLIINSTTKGQAGARVGPGTAVNMEEYSALAPAQSGVGAPDIDIQRNQQASLDLAAMIPKHVAFYDLIYAPEETVFLRHARLTGHPTMNGKAMIVCQAALGLFHHVCKREIETQGVATAETYNRIVECMYQAW